jgi:hypothetical protein
MADWPIDPETGLPIFDPGAQSGSQRPPSIPLPPSMMANPGANIPMSAGEFNFGANQNGYAPGGGVNGMTTQTADAPSMGFPAQGMTLNTSGPNGDPAGSSATPNSGGSIDFSSLLNSINPISSAEAATSPGPKALYGPQYQPPSALDGAMAAAHRFANRLGNSSHLGGLWNQVGNAPVGVAAVEGGNPAIANPPGPTNPVPAMPLPQPDRHMPWPPSPRAQVQPTAASPGGQGPMPYGSPWDPQGVGYAKSWDPQGVAMAASQRIAQQGQQRQAPVQGPMAAFTQQQPNSPFTMVLRPNAPAESGGRGQGGTPLSTALDLSGYQPPPPPAPRAINLGYGAPGVTSAPGRAPQAQAQAQASGGYNPFTHVWRDAPANRVPVGQPIANTWAPGASGIIQGRGGVEVLNPGTDISLNNPKSAVSRFFHNPGNQYPVNAPF